MTNATTTTATTYAKARKQAEVVSIAEALRLVTEHAPSVTVFPAPRRKRRHMSQLARANGWFGIYYWHPNADTSDEVFANARFRDRPVFDLYNAGRVITVDWTDLHDLYAQQAEAGRRDERVTL